MNSRKSDTAVLDSEQPSRITPDEDICSQVGASPLIPAASDKVGLSRSARSEVPIHGVRVMPTQGMSGWYIWAGEWSEDEHFFEPTHISHLEEVCELALPFLSLPPGWRFLTDGKYVDVWPDEEIEL